MYEPLPMNLQNSTFVTPCTKACCEEWLFLTTWLGSGAQSASKCRGVLSLDLGGRIQSSDSTIGNAATSLRNDWQYSVSAGLTYALSANFVVNAAYAVDFGRNDQDNVVNPQYREFNHQLVLFGATFKL